MSLNAAIMRFPLEQYLTQYGFDVDSRVERVLTCPTCQKSKLVVNLQKRAWHCWHCQDVDDTVPGRGGLLALIQLLEGGSKSDAVSRILQGYHDSVSLESIPVDELHSALVEAAGDVVPIAPPAFWRYGAIDPTGIMPYCHRRGITEADVVDFGLLWCSGGRYDRRLIFPVYEAGSLVYWQARAMWDESESREPRYVKALNPPKNPVAAGPSEVLMNLDVAKQHDRVAIVEGPIDCIHAGRDAVCTFGKKLSPIQIGKLLRAGVKKIDLMWDGPTEREPRGAWPEMFRAAPTLAMLFDVRLVFLPKGDPGDYTREQLRGFRQKTVRRTTHRSQLVEV